MCDPEIAADKQQRSPKEAELDSLSASDDSENEEQLSSTPFDPETHSSNDEEDEDQIIASTDAWRAKSMFSLKGGSSGFSDRSHNIFDSLDNAAKLASSTLGQDNVIDGVFARPLPPGDTSKSKRTTVSSSTTSGKKSVPDYLLHPERWTHYSLEDVAESSDSTNRMAAHQFLDSLQQRKEVQRPKAFCSDHKIIFSKPSQTGKELPVVGPLMPKDKEMQLSHLTDDNHEAGGEAGRAQRKRVHGCIEKGKETVKGGSHLVEEDEDEENPDERHSDAEDEEGKEGKTERKKDKQENDGEEEKQVGAQFTSFKRTNRKNYRKNSEQEDG